MRAASRMWVGALLALQIGFCGLGGAAVTASATYIDEIELGGQTDPNLVAFRSTSDDAWQAAVAGMDLGPGDSVWVKSGAAAVVKVGGTAVMHLESDTVFTIPGDGAMNAPASAAGWADSTMMPKRNLRRVSPLPISKVSSIRSPVSK